MGDVDKIQTSKIISSCSTISYHIYLIDTSCNGNISLCYGVDKLKIVTDNFGNNEMFYMETGTQ